MQGAPYCDFRYRYRADAGGGAGLPEDAEGSDNAAGTATSPSDSPR